MLPPTDLRRADLASGGVVVLLGLAVLLGAFQMPMGGTYAGVDNPWYASPAAVPLLLGGLLILLGGLVVRAAIRESGVRDGIGRAVSAFRRGSWRQVGLRIIGTWGGIAIYVGLLAGKPFGGLAHGFSRILSSEGHWGLLTESAGANYWVSSALFLIAYALIFRPGNVSQRYWKQWLIYSFLGLAPLLIGYLFSVHLFVPLP